MCIILTSRGEVLNLHSNKKIGGKMNENKNITKQKSSKPFGDVHPVENLEGIGPNYKEKLEGIGIKDTKQLWNANAEKIARETEISVSLIKSWQNMAELASVHDIGPQYAELIERSGVHSINQLAGYRPNQLLKLVQEKQETLNINIQGNTPGHDLVENWIKQAREHKSIE
jgi:nucleotidyltransferase/DNA polymerase involved in DNA repair